jgi:deazaflavin-dependent oxidoreductase (nitroreductase family)
VKIVKNVQPPAGSTRFLFRIPIHVYRLRLGWLFGSRLLLLNHIGRVSGKPRRTVLEVAEHVDDGDVVASGWGPTAAWYRNDSVTTRSGCRCGSRAGVRLLGAAPRVFLMFVVALLKVGASATAITTGENNAV